MDVGGVTQNLAQGRSLPAWSLLSMANIIWRFFKVMMSGYEGDPGTTSSSILFIFSLHSPKGEDLPMEKMWPKRLQLPSLSHSLLTKCNGHTGRPVIYGHTFSMTN